MGLSSELASQFAKVTNDSSRNTNGTKLYGTIAMLGEVPHVKLDGTEELTPISRTVEVAEGDRALLLVLCERVIWNPRLLRLPNKFSFKCLTWKRI